MKHLAPPGLTHHGGIIGTPNPLQALLVVTIGVVAVMTVVVVVTAVVTVAGVVVTTNLHKAHGSVLTGPL